MILLELGKLLEDIHYDQLPEKTVEKAKTAILNFFGGCMAGADAPLTMAEKALWESQNCSGNCVVLGSKGRTSSLAAAAINAAMGQIFLLEDCHEKTISHPGVVVIPIAMAIGQSLHASGKQIIEAIVVGYESLGRIGSVLKTPEFARFGLRPASILAPFGGAAAAAKLMGLKAEGIRDALSIAGNTVAGVMEFVNAGTPDICIQNCFAAKTSIMSAMLAAKGIQGSPSILEGRFGLGMAFNQKELDWSRILADNHGEYCIDDSFIKRFPGCGHVLPTAQAITSLVQKHPLDPEQVEKVTVEVSRPAKEFPGVDYQGPYSGTISAMMSHQFMVASVLVHGEISIDTVKMFDHPEVYRQAQKVVVEVDEGIDKVYPHKTGARVTVLLKDGQVITDFQEDILPYSRPEVIERLRKYASRYLSKEKVEEIIEKTLHIETMQSINKLMDLLEAEV